MNHNPNLKAVGKSSGIKGPRPPLRQHLVGVTFSTLLSVWMDLVGTEAWHGVTEPPTCPAQKCQLAPGHMPPSASRNPVTGSLGPGPALLSHRWLPQTVVNVRRTWPFLWAAAHSQPWGWGPCPWPACLWRAVCARPRLCWGRATTAPTQRRWVRVTLQWRTTVCTIRGAHFPGDQILKGFCGPRGVGVTLLEVSTGSAPLPFLLHLDRHQSSLKAQLSRHPWPAADLSSPSTVLPQIQIPAPGSSHIRVTRVLWAPGPAGPSLSLHRAGCVGSAGIRPPRCAGTRLQAEPLYLGSLARACHPPRMRSLPLSLEGSVRFPACRGCGMLSPTCLSILGSVDFIMQEGRVLSKQWKAAVTACLWVIRTVHNVGCCF